MVFTIAVFPPATLTIKRLYFVYITQIGVSTVLSFRQCGQIYFDQDERQPLFLADQKKFPTDH